MKKIYMKPEIMFEDFSLNQSMTVNCKAIVGGPTAGSCAYKVISSRKELNIFLSSMTNICTTFEDDDEYDGLCYHVFMEGVESLFNS